VCIVIIMKRTLLCTLVLLPLLALIACTPERRSPDAIREDTAKATADATRDAKAVVQGVADGLKQKGPININRASAEDLKALPGIDDDSARRIIDGRPYDNGGELVKKHVISRTEYDRIAEKIEAK
jgi:DNA uptake protein ComE-like DNA-binding protein